MTTTTNDAANSNPDTVAATPRAAPLPPRYHDRPRYLTLPKPVGGVWADLETSFWDLGASHNARPQVYQVGKDDAERKMGPGASITFKIPQNREISKEAVKVLFGKEGELRDAPPLIKDLARRAPVWVIEERDYYQVHNPKEPAHLMRIWLHAIGMNGFLPNRLSRGTVRRKPNRLQGKKNDDGSLLNRSFVWSQTVSPKSGVIQLTGWTIIGMGDLDNPDRQYNDGGVMVFRPMKVMIEGKERKLSIVQILTRLIFGTDWFFGAILGFMKAINPANFSDERMRVEAVEPDDEEVQEWGVEHRRLNSHPSLGAKLGDKMPKTSPAPEAPPPRAESDTAAESEPKPKKVRAKDRRKARQAAEGKGDASSSED